jgi:hypothetical protein
VAAPVAVDREGAGRVGVERGLDTVGGRALGEPSVRGPIGSSSPSLVNDDEDGGPPPVRAAVSPGVSCDDDGSPGPLLALPLSPTGPGSGASSVPSTSGEPPASSGRPAGARDAETAPPEPAPDAPAPAPADATAGASTPRRRPAGSTRARSPSR